MVFNDVLVTAELYGMGGHVGLVLGNIYAGLVGFTNVVAVIEETNLDFVSSSGIVSTLEGNNSNDPYFSSLVGVVYENVFASPNGGLSIDSYYLHKVIEGYNAVIEGKPVLDSDLSAAAAALNSPESVFLFRDGRVILKGFGFDFTE